MKLLELLNEEEKKLFKIKEYKADQVIFSEGDKCNELGIILNGLAVIETYSYNEKVEVINTLKKDSMFGQFLMFSNRNEYLGFVIAKRTTQIAFISKDDIFTLMNKNEMFLQTFLNLLCEETVAIKEQAKLYAHKNIRDRIMHYLTRLKAYGINTIDNVTTLSYELALPRPSVSRELTNLENDGLIERKNRKIYLK